MMSDSADPSTICASWRLSREQVRRAMSSLLACTCSFVTCMLFCEQSVYFAGQTEAHSHVPALQALVDAVRAGKLKKDGPILSFDDPTLEFPFLKFSKLFVRSFYDPLINDVLRCFDPKRPRELQCSVITGNPGIGKSAFGIYLLIRAIDEGRPVVYQLGGRAGDYFMIKDGVVTSSPAASLARDELLNNASTIYIVDSWIPVGNYPCTTILITSPRLDHFKEFAKQESARLYFFPVFTSNEINQLQRACYPDVDETLALKRYEYWGGVPRHIFRPNFDPDDHYGLQQLENAIVNTTPDEVLVDARKHSMESAAEVPHRAFHVLNKGAFDASLSPSDPTFYVFRARVPATEFVQRRLAEVWHQRYVDKLSVFLDSSAGMSELRQLRGYVLEHFARECLKAGDKFLIRNLATGKEHTQVLPKADDETEFSNMDDLRVKFLQSRNSLLIPARKNECAVDLVAPDGIMVQITTNEDHGIKVTPAEGIQDKNTCLMNVAKALGHKLGPGAKGEVPVYIAVPQDQFKSYPPQKLIIPEYVKKPLTVSAKKEIDNFAGRVVQYALRIPFQRWGQTRGLFSGPQPHHLGRVLRFLCK